MEAMMNIKQAACCATAVSLALFVSTSYAADDDVKSPSSDTTNSSTKMTGKQKATAIGAGTGAVAGAVVGGPVGAVVGAGIGGYVGHEGTDANGKVSTTRSSSAAHASDSKVRDAQAALNSQGYDAGAVDGQWGPNTQAAVRRFQAERGLAQSGTLDSATLNALGVNA
jgi:Putative peptidoglycan binding domain